MAARRLFPILAFALLFAPTLTFASAETDLISQIAGLFYVVVGLTLAVAFLLMGVGVLLWLVRLGTDQNYRDNAIRIMEWAIATLFTLILVLGVVEFVQTHTSATLYILGTAIILLLAWLIVTSDLFSGGGNNKKKAE